MEFRWIAIITLWTLISGPIFDQPRKARPQAARTAAVEPASHTSPLHAARR